MAYGLKASSCHPLKATRKQFLAYLGQNTSSTQDYGFDRCLRLEVVYAHMDSMLTPWGFSNPVKDMLWFMFLIHVYNLFPSARHRISGVNWHIGIQSNATDLSDAKEVSTYFGRWVYTWESSLQFQY